MVNYRHCMWSAKGWREWGRWAAWRSPLNTMTLWVDLVMCVRRISALLIRHFGLFRRLLRVFQWFTENSSVNYNTMHFYLQFWGIFTPLIRALISLAELFPILQWSSGLSCFSLRHTKANEREIVDCVEISSTAIVSSFILSCPLTTIWIRFETKI